MQKLEGAMRAYPWGSHTLLAQLRGQPTPTEHPEAELWFGAHPSNPGTVDGLPLSHVIAESPDTCLGSALCAAGHDTLPFLVKLLAADEPLSLQAHPSLEQARSGFERENAAGIPLSSDSRNYKDSNHKPELLVALTPFSAMAGFRPIEATRTLLQALNCPELDRYITLLDPQSPHDSLRTLFTTWITVPLSVRTTLIDAVIASAGSMAQRPDWIGVTLRNVLELNERYPGDAGVLISLMLNHIELSPGQALFLKAGQLHAYIRGLGVEVMANSDNVLRGGLTSKHVDVPELMRVVDFVPNPDPVIQCIDGHFQVPVEDFTVFSGDAPLNERPLAQAGKPLTQADRLDIQAGMPVQEGNTSRVKGHSSSMRPSGYPAIVLCTSGVVTLDLLHSVSQEASLHSQNTLTLKPGEAAWIPASDPDFSLSGGGHFFLAAAVIH